MQTEDVKQIAAKYAAIYENGGSAADEYEKDWNNGVYVNHKDAVAAVGLTDIYIAFKKGYITRERAVKEQRKILNEMVKLPTKPN